MTSRRSGYAGCKGLAFSLVVSFACAGAVQAAPGEGAAGAPLDLSPAARSRPSGPAPATKPAARPMPTGVLSPAQPRVERKPEPRRAAKKPVAPRAAKAGKIPALDDLPKLVLKEPGATSQSSKAPEPKAAETKTVDAKLAAADTKAAEAKAAEPRAAESKPAAAPAADAVDPSLVTRFCTNFSSAASEGRLAWQAKQIVEMEARMRDRIAELEAKRVETAEWIARREEALKKAEESVVAIYSKMRPEAAAAQFSAMDESGASAILLKLNPRLASTILNEIEAGRAARIAAEMAGVGVRREVARSVP